MFVGGKNIPATFDCATCHTQPGVKGAWLNGQFHANLGDVPQTCSACHYQEVKPLLDSFVLKMKHSSAQITQDCSTCHTMPTATQIATAGYPTAALWANGSFHARIGTSRRPARNATRRIARR